MPKRQPRASAPPARFTGWALFLLALALRWLFWQASPGTDTPNTPFLKGDAEIWLAYARGLLDGTPIDFGLPLRPPGAGYLIALLWSGGTAGVTLLRLYWCLLGAAVAPLLYATVRREFGHREGVVAGLFAAASTGLMLLSTSLDNEAPYVLLVLATLYLYKPVRERPTARLLALWGVLHAFACLTRVEHALFFAALLVYLFFHWRSDRGSWQRPLRHASAVGLAFALALLPWHLAAWSSIREFNRVPRPVNEVTEAALRRIEAGLAGVTWSAEAEAERQKLPAFARRTASQFVASTVHRRGRSEVRAADLEILEEAFGSRPEPLGAFPFVALYGGLNFALANHGASDGGFDRAILERPPPLAGGAHRYLPELVRGLPPPDLALTYPPHLEAVNDGYRLGFRWLAENPAAAARLAWRKLAISWDGAALGLTGYNLPLGLSGVRRPVDLVVPEPTPPAAAWRIGLLLLCAWGLRQGLRRDSSALAPWCLWLVTKAVVIVAFFGYARHGASLIPVLALFAALAVAPLVPSQREAGRHRRGKAVLALVMLSLVAAEMVRWSSPPAVEVGGRSFGSQDPWPDRDYGEHRIEVRPRPR